MQVGLLVIRAFVVDDMRDAIDIDAAGGNIGGDENVDFAGAECAQRLFTRSLPEITMDRSHGEAPLGEIVGDLLRLPLRAREDHRQAAVFRLQNACQQLHLVHRVSAPDVLFDRIDGCAVIPGVDRPHVGRLVHVATRESDDLARHGGGEQHRLPVGGNECDDLLDIGEEPHVEHFVRLIEHELAHVRKIEIASAGQIDDASGRADDDVDSCAKCVYLRLVGPASVNREHPNAQPSTGLLDICRDLESQLTCGADDQTLGLVLCRLGKFGVVLAGWRGDALDERDTEPQRLAGSGLRLTDDVAAFERQTQAHLLNRESGGDAVAGQGLDDGCADAEFGESLRFGCVWICGVWIQTARWRGLVDELVVRGAQQNSWVREAP